MVQTRRDLHLVKFPLLIFLTLYISLAIGQEAPSLTFTHIECNKVHTLKEGASVVIRYHNSAGKINKSSGNVNRISKDSIFIGNGVNVHVNDIQSIRTLSKRAKKTIKYLIVFLFSLGAIFATIAIIHSLNPANAKPIFQILGVTLLYSSLLLVIISIYTLFPARKLTNVGQNYQITFHGEAIGTQP